MREFQILSLGYDPILMPIRTILLRQAGYDVIEADSPETALEIIIKPVAIDLLLICHSVPSHEQENLISRVKSLNPRVPILCLTTSPLQTHSQSCSVACSIAPEFLEDVNRVLPLH
jgi:CheY-like chemotaxis protein